MVSGEPRGAEVPESGVADVSQTGCRSRSSSGMTSRLCLGLCADSRIDIEHLDRTFSMLGNPEEPIIFYLRFSVQRSDNPYIMMKVYLHCYNDDMWHIYIQGALDWHRSTVSTSSPGRLAMVL